MELCQMIIDNCAQQQIYKDFFGLVDQYDIIHRLDNIKLKYFQGLFPRNNLKNIRFSINFFTSIDLDELTNELRDLLKIHSTTGTYSQTKQQGKKQIENT
ncbi:unnamed protein product [Rotaria sp. Silwood1]|nr:unnamed protein product [Rotaria sp. Silwood1]CAF1419654.1 unnamed protein product [Rotaria sp. Silwood1]CAF3630532.1 unnamed protein product [Rotaria sp. Silwood1]CAF4792351.1 unnamed protein product [Rotaria sp. Silwood1]